MSKRLRDHCLHILRICILPYPISLYKIFSDKHIFNFGNFYTYLSMKHYFSEAHLLYLFIHPVEKKQCVRVCTGACFWKNASNKSFQQTLHTVKLQCMCMLQHHIVKWQDPIRKWESHILFHMPFAFKPFFGSYWIHANKQVSGWMAATSIKHFSEW